MLHAHKIIDNTTWACDRADEYVKKTLTPITNIQKRGLATSMWLVPHLKRAAKFDLGEYGEDDIHELAQTGLVMADEGFAVLPFETCYFEARVRDQFGVFSTGVLICPNEDREDDDVQYVAYSFDTLGGRKEEQWLLREVRIGLTDGFKTYLPQSIFRGMPEDVVDLKSEDNTVLINITLKVLGAAFALLDTSAVAVEMEPAPHKLNRAREKKGLAPLYEHHVVKIKLTKTRKVLAQGGTHASPRKHWRRGHSRVLHRGTPKERKIMIPACLVNGRGFISKDYKVIT